MHPMPQYFVVFSPHVSFQIFLYNNDVISHFFNPFSKNKISKMSLNFNNLLLEETLPYLFHK